jgi:Ca-activated chloride channel family protein
MSFVWPGILLLLPLPLLAQLLRLRRRRELTPAAGYSDLQLLGSGRGGRARWRELLPWLRVLTLMLLIAALARPRFGERQVEVTSEGIDIVLALDISGSMKAEDFQPHNRLHVAKEQAKKFIAGRPNDRIGLVVFASNSYTQAPITSDHEVLSRLIDEVTFGDIKDGTAIGMGIATSVNRLKDLPGKSRVLILLTDGRNNAGTIDPATAAELARSLRVRVYPIGVGQEEDAPYPVDDPVFGKRYVRMPALVDDEGLTRIAEITGGKYFRATDAQALDRIFGEVDRLEKTKVETREWVNYSEFGSHLALPALALLLLEAALGATWLRRLP